MYPYLLPEIFGYTVPLYDILTILGILLMLFYVANRLEKRDGYTSKQTNRMLILIIVSLFLALGSSFLIDGIFHSIQAGEASFGSISFLGGLIGGILFFLLLMKFFYPYKNQDNKKILNTVITGVVLAHAFGRIGCFCAGCCFGIPTESFLGVIFPHGHAHDVFPDTSIYPTQLFESGFLFLLFIALNKVDKLKGYELETYLFGYGTWRILIEFVRGDDRGEFLRIFTTEYNVFPTPSQFMSLLMILLGVYLIYKNHHQKQLHS
jgi:phosphatidylglycerol:prolipoprotein diacylglycerol transferase